MTKEYKRLLRKSKKFVYTYKVKLNKCPQISKLRRKRMHKRINVLLKSTKKLPK